VQQTVLIIWLLRQGLQSGGREKYKDENGRGSTIRKEDMWSKVSLALH
jgi:hypothetical protein